MDLINTSGFSVAWFPWKIEPPAWSLIPIVKATWDIRENGTLALSEEQITPTGDSYIEDDAARSMLYANDFAPIKPKVDLLLSGSCYAPGEKATDIAAATFGVGEWSKRLVVTARDVFAKKPLTWELAYGGAKVKENPIGVPGPEVVYRDRPNAKVPACFAPVPPSWPARMKRLGSHRNYGKKWLKTRFPWWPEKFDWTYYNAAPEDQQIKTLSGDELLFLENLHPKAQDLKVGLPGMRPRVFTLEGDAFTEIPVTLDTLWVDSDNAKLVLVWRGIREVRSEKFEELSHLYVASEPMKKSATADDHRKRLDESLKQEEEKEEEFEAEEPPEEESPKTEEPKPDPALEKLEKEAAAIEKEAGTIQSDAEKQLQEAAKKAGIVLPKKPPPMPKPEEIVKTITDSLLQAKKSLLDAGKAVPAGLQKAIDNPPKPEDFEIPEIKEEPEEPEPEEPEPEEPPPPSKEDVLQLIADKEPVENLDLTAIDLSKSDLAGAVFTNCILKEASFNGADLAGAAITGCVLASANLAGTNAKKASFAGSDLSEADLSGIDLTEAVLQEALFTKANMAKAKLAKAQAAGADFSQADLTGADLSEAKLVGAMLPEARLDDATLTGADLSDAGLMDATGKNLNAEGATLNELKAAGAKFPGANFKKTQSDGSIWEAADLSGANFSFSQLKGAEFSSANLEGAFLVACNAPEAAFAEANLKKADCTRLNLFRGTIEKADLTEALFGEANLFEAETWEAITEKTELTNANIRMTKLALNL